MGCTCTHNSVINDLYTMLTHTLTYSSGVFESRSIFVTLKSSLSILRQYANELNHQRRHDLCPCRSMNAGEMSFYDERSQESLLLSIIDLSLGQRRDLDKTCSRRKGGYVCGNFSFETGLPTTDHVWCFSFLQAVE